jgi:predicted O-linked N-acetylglucosamine transferase (SPINDLY family)
LALRPDDAGILYNRGVMLMNLERPEDALASYDKALGIMPDDAQMLYNRATALAALKRFEEELASYDKALRIKPDFAEALYNRAINLQNAMRLEEALENFDKVLLIRPDLAEAHLNRGRALAEMGRYAQAMDSNDRALANKPDFPQALNNRAALLDELRCFPEALAAFEKLQKIAPDYPYALGGMASAALKICDWEKTEQIADTLAAETGSGSSVVSPFTILGYSADHALQLQYAENYTRYRAPPRPQIGHHRASRRDKIKLAYLSGNFYDHAVARLTAELFERHDRSRFEVVGISFGPDDGSAMRARLARAFDVFWDVRRRSDEDVARYLSEQEVDIAIDLMGHTKEERIGILSYRPCPIQVSYLGYPGTTGAAFMDYIIADPTVLPFDQQAFYTERIVHLPECYQANDTRRRRESASRADWGLPEKALVFCCFNNNWKIARPVFESWMRLLCAVPGSVLWLLHDNDAAKANLRSAAAEQGVAPERLIFALPVEHQKHLARCSLADLFLDTLPYNAHTTASDALWAGVPLVTQMGNAFAGRVAASLLQAAGLPELVTANAHDYENLALSLARDTARRMSIREKLERRLQRTPLFNADRLRRNIEAAYMTMWEISRSGRAPASFAVPLPPENLESIIRR